MKLFLASEAKNEKSFPKLQEFVGGFEGKKIAYIPTAANGDGYGSWKEGGSWKLVQSLGAKIDLIQLEENRDETVAEKLKQVDIIWMAGGYVGYLMYWLKRTQLDKHIQNLLDEGIVYIGSSAGSMVAAPTIDICEWYIGEIEHGTKDVGGLNLVDFEIYPHYNEEYLEEINAKYEGKKMYLLKDGEAIIVDGDNIEVFGEERIVSNNL